MSVKGDWNRTQDRDKAAKNNDEINWPLRKARKEELEHKQKEGK